MWYFHSGGDFATAPEKNNKLFAAIVLAILGLINQSTDSTGG